MLQTIRQQAAQVITSVDNGVMHKVTKAHIMGSRQPKSLEEIAKRGQGRQLGPNF